MLKVVGRKTSTTTSCFREMVQAVATRLGKVKQNMNYLSMSSDGYWNKHGMTMDNGAKVADQQLNTGEVGRFYSRVLIARGGVITSQLFRDWSALLIKRKLDGQD